MFGAGLLVAVLVLVCLEHFLNGVVHAVGMVMVGVVADELHEGGPDGPSGENAPGVGTGAVQKKRGGVECQSQGV